MLLRFRFSNFRSFRAQQELSMVAASLSDMPEAVIRRSSMEGLLPVAAIYGANASGKTNVLSALSFMKRAVQESHREWEPDAPVPHQPFQLDEVSINASSNFSADFLVDDTRYQYGFVAESRLFAEEWLYAYPNGKKQAWFARKKGQPIVFGSRMRGENRLIEGLTRPNSLFLSAAAQNNHESLTPIYDWFVRRVVFITSDRSGGRSLTISLCQKGDFAERVSQMLRFADVGIDGLRLRKRDLAQWEKIIAAMMELPQDKAEQATALEQTDVELLHQAGSRTVAFATHQESDGTIAYLSLLGPVIQAFTTGGIVCVDELDASLHPLLALELIRLFNSQEQNPRGAQLIFTTHDTNLLSAKVMRRDQIWFTEKARDGSSKLYPLTDFKPRRGENLANGYLQGRYGAVPFINADAILLESEPEDAKV